MANFVEPCIQDEINERLRRGQSLRAIAAELEISKGTVWRYRQLLFGTSSEAILCPCGQPAGHRGWCSVRFQASPARQAFVSKWAEGRRPAIIRIKAPPRLDLRYPFLQPKLPANPNGLDLLLLVNGHVPKGLPEQLRGDVCQDIITAILSGELAETEIPKQLASFIRRARGSAETHYMAVSLDQPMRDGSSWHDRLAAPTAEDAEIFA